MPRQRRLDLPGIPQHVIQRGNNRQPCFLREQDYRCYLSQLDEAARTQRCRVHAYVLMTNHVHLLMTPETAGAVARTMQSLGRRYVGYFNASYRRSGTLWEGRYKACLVDSECYLLACYRYIELNPVRAAMVAAPGDYAWSSYRANAEGRADRLVCPHDEYARLGATVDERCAAYRALFLEAIGEDRMSEIRAYVQQQRAVGSSRFQAAIEAELKRVATVRPRGRPPGRIRVAGSSSE
ncbi:MAG: transposase [Pseudomonadota bacterium]|nr:transposase [Xanthomonadaceae bacterium]MDE2248122.1 transposase [Xanthomonadaceae bacterium]MDE3209919.1 transposase [Pseudomonadota bacterium]